MELTGKELVHDAANDPNTATCRRCLREFKETWSPTTPIDELGQVLLKNVNNYYTDELCPDCKEQLSIFTLLWFNK